MTWPVVALAEVAEVRLGRQRAPKNHQGDSMRPYIRAANIKWGGLDLTDVKTMNFTDAEMLTYRMQPGDIVLSEASGSPGEVGKPALWSGEISDCAFQNTLIRVRSDAHEPKFLLYYFRHQALDGRFLEHSRGVGIHHLGRTRLAGWPTPVPPLDEQRRIVDALDDHISRLDAADAGLASSELRLSALRRSLLAELHCGPPVPLGDLALDSGYGTSEKCLADGPGVPVVRIPNLIDGVIDLADEKRIADPAVDVSNSMLHPGDLLIVRTNGSVDLIGRSAVVQDRVNAAFASYLIRYRLREDLVRPAWVQAMLSTPQVRRTIEPLAASSAGQHNLSLAKLNPLELPVPSLGQQDAGLARLRASDSRMTSLRADLSNARVRSAALRRSLFAAAFSGQLATAASSLPFAEG